MSELVVHNEISEEDYRAIEEAVMETARGRWFLAEYAKRNRVSDTNKVLEAVDGLKHFITREHEPADVLQMRLDIVELTHTIEQLKQEIANMGGEGDGDRVETAQVHLNVVVDETEKATSDILQAAEEVQEIAWNLRDSGQPEEICEKLDVLATEIYTACSFQDLTGQRLRKVVDITTLIETRLQSMVSLWGDDELDRYRKPPAPQSDDLSLVNGPALPGAAHDQGQIDEMMHEVAFQEDGGDYFQISWADEESETPDQKDTPFLIEEDFDVAASDQEDGLLSATGPDQVMFAPESDDDETFDAETEDNSLSEEIVVEAHDEVEPVSEEEIASGEVLEAEEAPLEEEAVEETSSEEEPLEEASPEASDIDNFIADADAEASVSETDEELDESETIAASSETSSTAVIESETEDEESDGTMPLVEKLALFN